MDDRELLKAAAKAAGIDTVNQPYSDSIYTPTGGLSWKHWNPLNDDGDALRLAVKLDMGIEVMLSLGETRAGDGDQEPVAERHGTDPYAATRRAIVRAAAEIGSQQ